MEYDYIFLEVHYFRSYIHPKPHHLTPPVYSLQVSSA